MKQKKYPIKRIKEIIRETIKDDYTNAGTYYIHSSSLFFSEYDINKVKDAVKRSGGLHVRMEKSNGISDEKFVVVFEVASDTDKEDLARNVAQNLNTDWVLIKKR